MIFYLPSSICLTLIVYFYIKIFREVFNRKLEHISEASALVKVQQERNVAKTTALLTSVVMSSYTPSIIIGVLGYRDPTLRQSLFFLWTQVFIQLNSLANPLVYCFRNRHFRNAVLELLKIRQPNASHKAVVNRFISYKTDATFKLVNIKAQPDCKVCKLPTDTNLVEEKRKGPRQPRKGKSRSS